MIGKKTFANTVPYCIVGFGGLRTADSRTNIMVLGTGSHGNPLRKFTITVINKANENT